MWKEILQTKSITWLSERGQVDLLTIQVKAKVAELVDIIDKQAYLDKWEIRAIGSIEKSKAHETGDFHLAGHVWIYNTKWEVLLQKRAKIKDSYPGLWDISAAGHISAWETMDIWVVREVVEELWEATQEALEKNKLEPIFTYIEDVEKIMRWKPWHNHELNSVYLLKYDWRIEDLKMQEEEVEELRFMSIEQFEREIKDPELKEKYVPHREEYFEKLFQELKKKAKNNIK